MGKEKNGHKTSKPLKTQAFQPVSKLVGNAISSGCNGFQLHPLHFISLFVFACVAFAFENLSADMCSLLFSYLGFILSVLGYVGGSSMDVNVVVVVGCNKVGSNNMRGQKQ